MSMATETQERSEKTSIRANFGEDLEQILDLSSWRPGENLAQEYPRLEREVREAMEQESQDQQRIRSDVFPRLFDPDKAPPGGGIYTAQADILDLVHRGLLLNGGVEACDGIVHVHDTLPLTVYQIGISLVSYRGDRGTWQQRLFRRDLRERGADPIQEVLELLERRSARSSLTHSRKGDRPGEMARKALVAYAERAILLNRSQAVWRMGHGNPVPYELLTGADYLELMVAGTNLMRSLIEGHQKFVFVSREPRDLLLLTVGQALRPLEYAIVCTLEDRLRSWLHQLRYTTGGPHLYWDQEQIPASAWIPWFLERVASQVVVGLYRATATAPTQMFYTHVKHAHVAAHLLLADSLLQDQRGFPLLLDLAQHVCGSVFGNALRHLTESAYAAAGAPFRYHSERPMRDI